MHLSGQRVLVLGLGVSGTAAAKALSEQGAEVFVWDDLSDRRERSVWPVAEDDSLRRSCTLCVLSPGIPMKHPICADLIRHGVEVIGEVELAVRLAKRPLLAVTGTNGKTSTTKLIEHCLNSAGHPAQAMGNIGLALCESLPSLSNHVTPVVELSSYQIEQLQTPCLAAAVILNIAPDHLDRYGSMERYAGAKCGVSRIMLPDGQLYVQAQAASEYATLLASATYHTFDASSGWQIDQMADETVPEWAGQMPAYERENVLGAYCVARSLGVTFDQVLESSRAFKRPPHRIEFVRELGGVRYFDDSKGTNLSAVQVAVEAMQGSVILIAGGQHKGSPYHIWNQGFKGKVRHVLAIGQAAPLLKEDLQADVSVTEVGTLESAVQRAHDMACPGDCVLLSPGCASFDQFTNFEHRGNRFQELVKALDSE